jgi:hypothetical protein
MKTIDNKKADLIRQYHTICQVNGLNQADKEAILEQYNVKSSRDLTEEQLAEVIAYLNSIPDNWRKRLMAAIGGYLRSVNKDQNINIIKAIACRASGYDDFNRIPVSRLRDVYYEFVRKQKTTATSQYVKASMMKQFSSLN